jgi:lipopolysaccharide/colanic/teichoic acid biosynthesis glycosyltransferase
MIPTSAKRRWGASRFARVLVGESPPPPAPTDHQSLVEQYAAMAHVFQPRPVDHLLRALDLAVGGVASVITAPVALLIVLALKVSSPRAPALYRGWRVGRGGHLFEMLKFRTLAPDAEDRLGPFLGPELTQLTESEVSRIGRALRASRLDELPQLYNVLRGDMSLVGPRPIRPRFFEELCVGIPEYWQRLVVRPGVTGLAQLRLTREMTWAEKLAHDLEYIADRSIRLYLSVIATTVWLVVMRPANRRSVLNRLP